MLVNIIYPPLYNNSITKLISIHFVYSQNTISRQKIYKSVCIAI